MKNLPLFIILISLSILLTCTFNYEPSTCGDINNDGAINVIDADYMIQYIFQPDAPIIPTMENGDTNCDGEVDIGDAVYLINYVSFPDQRPPCDCPTGFINGMKGCNFSRSKNDPPSNQECIRYSYEDNTLYIEHLNAAFNCCIEDVDVDMETYSNHVNITENDILEGNGCRCECLYDLYFEIYNIPFDGYKINIIRPYPDDIYSFEIKLDLANEPTGIYCIERDHYPYGQ